jgi:hypothetical protein
MIMLLLPGMNIYSILLKNQASSLIVASASA